MTRVFFTSESARLAGKRSGEARRAHKANGTNDTMQTALGSVTEQQQTRNKLVALAWKQIEKRIESARLPELIAFLEFQGAKPPRNNQVSESLRAALDLLKPESATTLAGKQTPTDGTPTSADGGDKGEPQT